MPGPIFLPPGYYGTRGPNPDGPSAPASFDRVTIAAGVILVGMVLIFLAANTKQLGGFKAAFLQ